MAMKKVSKGLLVTSLLLLNSAVEGLQFDVESQNQCINSCVDSNNVYFSNINNKQGVCCTLGELQSEKARTCDQGGLSNLGRDQLKYFACPTGRYCNAVKLRAQTNTQIYRINTNQLQNEYICNHHIMFSVDAGVNDKIKMRFIKWPKGTKVSFAVGETYATANGLDLTEAQYGFNILEVGFPAQIFLTIEHSQVDRGDFSFEFWYQNREPTDDKVTAYSLESTLPPKEEEADLLWVYILGGALGLWIFVIICFVLCRVRSAKTIEEEVKQERANGIMPAWGVRTQAVIALKEEQDAAEQAGLNKTDDKTEANASNQSIGVQQRNDLAMKGTNPLMSKF